MIFPRGQALYENLNTSFTQLDAMLAELQNNQFTGYVQLTGWEYEGVLLFDTGRIVNASEEVKGQRRHGPSAATNIALKSKEKDNAISVYRLPSEVTQLLANLFHGEVIYKDLTNDLTGLDKLVAKLQSEKHTGAIEARSTKRKNAATILMREGQILECMWSNQGVITSGQVLDKIIQSMANDVALFTVYRADLMQVYSVDLDLADSFARPGVLTVWQTVLQTVETAVDRLTKAGTFNLAFRRACIVLAADYPFLDPFAREFAYREGQITFEGKATIAQFNAGLSRCLAQAVRDLATLPTASDVLTHLHAAATRLRDESYAQLEQLGLTAALPEVFGP